MRIRIRNTAACSYFVVLDDLTSALDGGSPSGRHSSCPCPPGSTNTSTQVKEPTIFHSKNTFNSLRLLKQI